MGKIDLKLIVGYFIYSDESKSFITALVVRWPDRQWQDYCCENHCAPNEQRKCKCRQTEQMSNRLFSHGNPLNYSCVASNVVSQKVFVLTYLYKRTTSQSHKVRKTLFNAIAVLFQFQLFVRKLSIDVHKISNNHETVIYSKVTSSSR